MAISMLIHISCKQSLLRGVSIDDLLLVEEIVERNMFIYNFDFQELEYVEKLVKRSIGNFEKTVKVLRLNKPIIQA